VLLLLAPGSNMAVNPLKEAQLRAIRSLEHPAAKKPKTTAPANGGGAVATAATGIMPPPAPPTLAKSAAPMTPSTSSLPPGTPKTLAAYLQAQPKVKPLLRQVHDVLEYLKQHTKEVSLVELGQAVGFSVQDNHELLQSLQSNPKIHYEDGMMSFRVSPSSSGCGVDFAFVVNLRH
jgi:hypothetical protein